MFNLDPRIILFDTEFTTWEGAMARNWSGPGEYREVVQIGAIKIETESFTEISSFNLLIKPVKNPALSEYFMNLTQISQEAVDRNGVPFHTALKECTDWVEGFQLYSWGLDGDVLASNAKLLSVPFPFSSGRCKDIRPVFSNWGIDTKNYMSSTIPLAFGLPLRDNAHDALNDARSIADGLRGLKEKLGMK